MAKMSKKIFYICLMKRNIALTIAVALSIFFFACKEDDIPVPLPPPPPPSAQAADDSALLAPEAEIADSPPAPTAEKPARVAEKPAPAAENPAFFAEYAEQLSSGRYTIQVAIFPTRSSAKALVKKIEDRGIKAYYAKVYNPAKLLGSYYRVRVGFFNGKSVAEQFAKTRLEPLGYRWWVDERRNDNVGNAIIQVDTSVEDDGSLEAAKQAYKELAKAAIKAVSSSSVAPVSSSSHAIPKLPPIPK